MSSEAQQPAPMDTSEGTAAAPEQAPQPTPMETGETAAEVAATQEPFPTLSCSIFGRRQPFVQFSPNPFGEGGIGSLFGRSFGRETEEKPRTWRQQELGEEAMGKEGKPAEGGATLRAGGRYSFQLALRSAVTDAEGKTHSERFSSSDVGHFGHGGLRETHQAYSNLTAGTESRALEQHVGQRARKWVKDRDAAGKETTGHKLSGMSEGETADFDRELNLNCHHLPAHTGFHGGILAGFGEHPFMPFDGAADWHTEPLPCPLPVGGPAEVKAPKPAPEVEVTEAQAVAVEVALPPFSECLFGQRDPFQQLSPNPFREGGIASLFGQSFGRATEEEVPTIQAGGRYSFQVAIMSCFADENGKLHSERFSSSDVGHFGHGGLRETHQAYSHSTFGLEKRALEQHVGQRARKWVKERDAEGKESTQHLFEGMDEGDTVDFERDLNMNCHHLPGHSGFHGGILAGFGDHRFKPLEGRADWHKEPLPSVAPVGGRKGGA